MPKDKDKETKLKNDKEKVATVTEIETEAVVPETSQIQLEDAVSEVVNLEIPQVESESGIEFESETKAESASEVVDSDVTVTVQPVKFASFEDLNQAQGEVNKNLDILMDIKLQLTVELGRTELPIKKVLELTRGSIIELEKVAGEPVELYANGKLVAHGEVVVIEDNFGLRITSITEPEDRLKGI